MAARLKKPDKQPDSSKTALNSEAITSFVFDNNANTITLAEKLESLAKILKKSFKVEFIDSISHLIKLENQSQAAFNLSLETQPAPWPKLEYFLHQLKKIIKHKSQLLELVNNMQIHHHSKTTHSGTKIKNATNILNEYYNKTSSNTNLSYLNLVIEFTDFTKAQSPDQESDHNNDYFLLTNILVRLLYKLINYSPTPQSNLNAEKPKLDNLMLLLLSSLADLSFYQELRVHVTFESLFYF
jgi:hypothetical protein